MYSDCLMSDGWVANFVVFGQWLSWYHVITVMCVFSCHVFSVQRYSGISSRWFTHSCQRVVRGKVDCILSVDMLMIVAGHSGLVITCLTVVQEIPGSNVTVGSLCICHKTTEIYSFMHILPTLTAVSTVQDNSAIRGMWNRVSAFRLSTTKWWRW